MNSNCTICSTKLIKLLINGISYGYKCESCKTLIVEPGCYRSCYSNWVMLIECSGDYFYHYEDQYYWG